MKHIHIIATGGTIAGKGKNIYDLANYTPGVIPIEDILGEMPGLSAIAEISAEDFCNIGSEDITLDHWLRLAKRINLLAGDSSVDGIVITHGTDTMEETAFFLNLVTQTAKPIVLTGAMLPATAQRPDGPGNLADAVRVAADDKSHGRNVMVVMNHSIFSANQVHKLHSSSINAFAAPNGQRLGYVKDSAVIWQQQDDKINLHFDISRAAALPRVEILAMYADCSPEILRQMLALGMNNIVFDSFGNGTMPLPLTQLLAAADGIFINTTQTGSGKAEHIYTNIINGGSCTAKQARIITMLWLAANPDDKKQLCEYLQREEFK